jgi:hypothetical protein
VLAVSLAWLALRLVGARDEPVAEQPAAEIGEPGPDANGTGERGPVTRPVPAPAPAPASGAS